MANADDALNFVDSSTLDSLDETDPNCTTHLTHISEILTPSNASQQVVFHIYLVMIVGFVTKLFI